jgi:hypothetical protein
MKYLPAILLAFAMPAWAGQPKSCGGDKPPPPPNPVTPTVKKHKSDGGLSLAEGAAIVVGVGLVCNLTEGCKVKQQ